MPITISKHYEENAIIGNFKSSKVGITLHSDKQLTTPEEVKDYSDKLGELAKTLVRQELQKIKEEPKQD